MDPDPATERIAGRARRRLGVAAVAGPPIGVGIGAIAGWIADRPELVREESDDPDLPEDDPTSAAEPSFRSPVEREGPPR